MYLYEFENMLGVFEEIKCRFTAIFKWLLHDILSSFTKMVLLTLYARTHSFIRLLDFS